MGQGQEGDRLPGPGRQRPLLRDRRSSQPTTVNYRAVPTSALRPGQNYWRVRATQGSTNSSWTGRRWPSARSACRFPSAPATTPSSAQPQSPPLLRWQGSAGSHSYTVEVDGDADFIGAKVYTTKNTSLVVTDPLVADDYYWRVTAAKAAGIVSVPSVASRFVIKPLAAPTLIYPPNDVNLPVEDVVMDWAPVPGAKSYDLQVATDSGFNTITESRSNIQSTRYSPITTLRQQPVLVAGPRRRPGRAEHGVDRVAARLQARVAGQAQAVFPLGSAATPPALVDHHPVLPVDPGAARHATTSCQLANDVNFSSDVRPARLRARPTPRTASRDCGFNTGAPPTGGSARIDLPYHGGGRPGHLLRPPGRRSGAAGGLSARSQLRDRHGSQDRHRRSGPGHVEPVRRRALRRRPDHPGAVVGCPARRSRTTRCTSLRTPTSPTS